MAYCGKVKWYNQKHQYGFIENNGRSPQYVKDELKKMLNIIREKKLEEHFMEGNILNNIIEIVEEKYNVPKQLFVHKSDIVKHGDKSYELLVDNESVEYDVDYDKEQDASKQYKAVNVCGPDGGVTLYNNSSTMQYLSKYLRRRSRPKQKVKNVSNSNNASS